MSNPVKEVREALGLTQKEMAAKMGCGSATERRCEYEARLPTNVAVRSNFLKLAKQAGIDVHAMA
jgi:DNA-binding transcriptional regulator YiaG